MICHLYIAQNIDTVLCISTQMINIYIVLCTVFCTHIYQFLCIRSWSAASQSITVSFSFLIFAHPIGKHLDQSFYTKTVITLITLLSLEKRTHLASFISFVLRVFECNLTIKNSSSSISSSLISSGVVIEDNFFKNEVISSMEVHVSKKHFSCLSLMVMTSCCIH